MSVWTLLQKTIQKSLSEKEASIYHFATLKVAIYCAAVYVASISQIVFLLFGLGACLLKTEAVDKLTFLIVWNNMETTRPPFVTIRVSKKFQEPSLFCSSTNGIAKSCPKLFFCALSAETREFHYFRLRGRSGLLTRLMMSLTCWAKPTI